MDYLPFILAAAVVILIRILAGTNNLLGKICRWFWNVSFKIASFIPFCGWMAHFMIADTEKERAVKNYHIQVGTDADAFGVQLAEDAIERRRAQERKMNAIRNELAARGLTDISINADGTFATAKDRHGNVCNVHISAE